MIHKEEWNDEVPSTRSDGLQVADVRDQHLLTRIDTLTARIIRAGGGYYWSTWGLC